MKHLLLATLLSLLVATPASAQTVEERVDLGDGLAVTRLCPVGLAATVGCWAWRPAGFTFGDAAEMLGTARTFSRAPSGAIIAVLGMNHRGSGVGGVIVGTGQPRLVRSTDGGEHWSEVYWPWYAVPTTFAFDASNMDGVAIGEQGYVWTTHDGGEHWIDRGGSSSSRWVEVAIAAGEIVLLDAAGGVFRTHDGGFRRETVLTDPSAHLEQRERDIVVHTDTADYVIARGRSVRRVPLTR